MTEPSKATAGTALIAGCGYLGRRVAESWQQAGLVTSVVTRSAERAADFREQNLKPVVCDLSDPQVRIRLPQADLVLWAVGFDRSAGVPREQIWLDGLKRLIEGLSSAPQRFLYVSSTSVYGQTDGETINEHSATNPVTEGGQCCLQAEQLAREVLADRFPTTQLLVLRMAGIYGPDRLLRRTQDLLSKSPLAGEPDHDLNLIHVDDAVRMVRYAASAMNIPDVINVVNSGTVTRRIYYERLAELVSAPAPVFDGAGNSTLRPRSGNKRVTSRYHLSGAADFLFDDVLTGLADAVNRSG
ncbi:MAG: NAD-dependent epimerase/dehydratase family protein [Planctomycetaceae bacterium]